MSSPKFWVIVRISIVAGLLGLFVTFSIFISDGTVRAAPVSRLVLQDTATPGYDAPTDEAPTDQTPTGASGYPGSDVTGTVTPPAGFTPSVVGSPTMTATLPPDVFRTEDSEINQSLTTPVATDTPAPTNTVYHTATVERTQVGTTLTPLNKEKEAGFAIDWGLFWIGFSLPVIGLCGVVLYLLDRRPDLFRRYRK